MAARKLNQTSQFGGLLDMITDRCATLGLLILLSNEYSHGELSNIFQWVCRKLGFNSSAKIVYSNLFHLHPQLFVFCFWS